MVINTKYRHHHYDNESTVASLGFGLKLCHAANPMMEGKAYARFPLKMFAPRDQGETVHLQISFDGGNAVDSLFAMSIE